MNRPAFIKHWQELETADDATYPGDTELMSIGAPLGHMMANQKRPATPAKTPGF